jgi:hypothetical protein
MGAVSTAVTGCRLLLPVLPKVTMIAVGDVVQNKKVL